MISTWKSHLRQMPEIFKKHKHGSIIEPVTLKNAPTNDMRYPKIGRAKATMTELNTKQVLMRRLDAFFLEPASSLFSIASTVGVTISAYLAIGVIKVAYMTIFELILSLGRFKVIWDRTSEPNIRQPEIAISP